MPVAGDFDAQAGYLEGTEKRIKDPFFVPDARLIQVFSGDRLFLAAKDVSSKMRHWLTRSSLLPSQI